MIEVDSKRSLGSGTKEWPRPWWFSLALRLCPDRCREIPEAQDPSRIVLRQVALWKRHLYLQQFASGEDVGWMHSHQWRRTFALGLWGGYVERRHGLRRYKQAPYLYTMGPDVVHHVQAPTPGHTSLFLGLWRDDDLKHYFRVARIDSDGVAFLEGRHWERHVKVQVKRI